MCECVCVCSVKTGFVLDAFNTGKPRICDKIMSQVCTLARQVYCVRVCVCVCV